MAGEIHQQILSQFDLSQNLRKFLMKLKNSLTYSLKSVTLSNPSPSGSNFELRTRKPGPDLFLFYHRPSIRVYLSASVSSYLKRRNPNPSSNPFPMS